jgi:hypothetical protein
MVTSFFDDVWPMLSLTVILVQRNLNFKLRVKRRWMQIKSKIYHCCGSKSGIRCLFDPWIRDPEWVKSKDPDPGSGSSGSGMNNPDHVSESLETIFWLKYLNSFMRIRDGKNSDPGTGMETNSDPESGKAFRIRNTAIYQTVPVLFPQIFKTVEGK